MKKSVPIERKSVDPKVMMVIFLMQTQRHDLSNSLSCHNKSINDVVSFFWPACDSNCHEFWYFVKWSEVSSLCFVKSFEHILKTVLDFRELINIKLLHTSFLYAYRIGLRDMSWSEKNSCATNESKHFKIMFINRTFSTLDYSSTA